MNELLDLIKDLRKYISLVAEAVKKQQEMIVITNQKIDLANIRIGNLETKITNK